MRKLIDETGNRYGRLVVIERVKNIGSSAAWLCRCDCGNETIVRGGGLRKGSTRSCGCLRREEHSKRFTKDETGKRYGRLVVIKRVNNSKTKQAQWLCHCDCGNTKIVRGVCLREGSVQSCGCLRKLPEGEAAFNDLLRAYKSGAKARGFSWNLTEEQFRELTHLPCYYCGTEPARIWQQPKTNGPYVCNGVDRMDNSKGYKIGNVVPCCEICNRAKKDIPAQELEEWLDQACFYRHCSFRS